MNDDRRAWETLSNGGTTSVGGQRNKVLGALVVGILVLGSIAVYQQLQLSALSRTISLQSSELANPASSVVISNFTITKQNATDAPVMYIVFWNNGTAPAISGTLLVGNYGQNNAIRYCYNSSQSENPFPIFTNESAQMVAPLSCGSIGDSVSLTASVEFVTGHGSVTKVYSTKTTIELSKFQRPTTIIINQIGILTFILPAINNGVTYNQWSLTVTNYASKSIVSINATATSPNGSITGENTCVIPALRSVSQANPLTPHASCGINNYVGQRNSRFSIGTRFLVTVSVVYSDGSKGTASTAAIVEPPYII
jgi:hypothetical protein